MARKYNNRDDCKVNISQITFHQQMQLHATKGPNFKYYSIHVPYQVLIENERRGGDNVRYWGKREREEKEKERRE